MLGEDLIDKVTIEQRPTGSKGASQVDIWRKYGLGRRNSNCQGYVAKLSRMSKRESGR